MVIPESVALNISRTSPELVIVSTKKRKYQRKTKHAREGL